MEQTERSREFHVDGAAWAKPRMVICNETRGEPVTLAKWHNQLEEFDFSMDVVVNVVQDILA